LYTEIDTPRCPAEVISFQKMDIALHYAVYGGLGLLALEELTLMPSFFSQYSIHECFNPLFWNCFTLSHLSILASHMGQCSG